MQITMKCKNATRISFQLTCFYFKRKPSFNDTRQFCGHRYYVAILWLGRALLRQVQNLSETEFHKNLETSRKHRSCWGK